MPVLQVQGLKKAFHRGFIPRRTQVLKGVEFKLEPGTITGFLGANGAGKTTTMKCILGLAQPDEGNITFFNGQPLNLTVKNKIGFLPERPYFYEYLTGEEFLRFYGQLSMRLSRADLNARISELLELVGLTEARHRRLRAYSKGMLQKIGFAQAIIHRPEIVILDEPVSGLDPDGRQAIADLIQQIAKQGAAVFFSSHLMHDTEKLCQNLVILRDGVVMYQGGTRKFLQDMGVSFEIAALVRGERQVWSGLDASQAQNRLRELVQQGATVTQVGEQRKSLEEAFVATALRKGP
ncbi:MAG: ABC transporter ATP-binding protein [Bdellovibrionales bacterium]